MVETQEYPSLLKCDNSSYFWISDSREDKTLFLIFWIFSDSRQDHSSFKNFHTTTRINSTTYFEFLLQVIFRVSALLLQVYSFQDIIPLENKLSVSYWRRVIITLHQRELIIFHPQSFWFLNERENKLSVSYCSTHYYFIQKKLIILPTTRRYLLFLYFKFYVIENF